MKKHVFYLLSDQEVLQHAIQEHLQKSHLAFEYLAFETLREASLAIEQKQPDLLFMAWSLPGSSGLRAYQQIEEQLGLTPIVILLLEEEYSLQKKLKRSGLSFVLVDKRYSLSHFEFMLEQALQQAELKRNTRELKQRWSLAEKRFVEAQDIAQFGSWELELLSNEMRWSETLFHLLGFEINSLQPSLDNYLNRVHGEDYERVRAVIEQAGRDGKVHKIEYRIRTHDTRLKHVYNQMKMHYDELKESFVLLGIVQDLTEQKRTQAIIAERNFDKSAARIQQELLKDLSFHVRTPLSSIVNLSYLILQNEADVQQREYLEGLRTSADDLNRSLNNLLNVAILFSDKVKLEDRPFVLDDFVNSLLKSIELKAGNKNITVKKEIAEEVPQFLLGDMYKIQQVLYNLLDNAVRYTRRGGEVQFLVHVAKERRDQVVLRFEIIDNGQGMKPEELRRLKKAYKLLQLDYQEEGKKSLGIPIAQKLLQQLSGRMVIRSTEGEGSHFKVELPIAKGKEKEAPLQNAPSKPLKILFVEDHFLNQIATRKVLTTWSDFVDVEIAKNGQLGVEKFKQKHFDIVLMDLQMPIMNGFEATQHIRQDSDVPIIALTANASAEESEKCLKAGMNDYLPKPFKPDELYEKIMSVL